MIPLPKSALGIAAGITGILFIGYCIYFDRQRHNDPNFKKKLREKRKAKRMARLTGSRLPDLRDAEAVQKFFLSEVQLGEDLLGQGDEEGAVEHLGCAVAVCGHPQQLMGILQQTLPPQVYELLLSRLPMIGQHYNMEMRRMAGEGVPDGPVNYSGPVKFGGVQPATPASVLEVDDELE